MSHPTEISDRNVDMRSSQQVWGAHRRLGPYVAVAPSRRNSRRAAAADLASLSSSSSAVSPLPSVPASVFASAPAAAPSSLTSSPASVPSVPARASECRTSLEPPPQGGAARASAGREREYHAARGGGRARVSVLGGCERAGSGRRRERGSEGREGEEGEGREGEGREGEEPGRRASGIRTGEAGHEGGQRGPLLKVELEALEASASLSTRTTSSTSAYDAYKSASWHHGRVTADGESLSGDTSVRRGALEKAATERAARWANVDLFLHPTTLAAVAGSHCELELTLLRRLSLGCFPGALPRISRETMSGCCWRKCKNGVSGCDAPTQRPSARRRRFEWTCGTRVGLSLMGRVAIELRSSNKRASGTR
ncbi:hypothetical protein DFH08DRAFT_809157 [Mycena albidolilacea]|uniref:Uncharacterized protein n=1 Tax=Mycena albidolilacea TaxID=1033008 RepID=A0AAD7ESS5_9AGAR|nr:hypothetical protein DFH08DRAFT_809157 [Mycena albidolilacea]